MRRVAHSIAEKIITQLANGKQVLWLVPGGSSISVAALAAEEISAVPHNNLTVTLTDERYGPIDHPDSNWRQLTGAGFNLPDAHKQPVLTGFDIAQTTNNFALILQQGFEASDFTLGFFGIGADGHTAGILPGSPAVGATEHAVSYNASSFERVTMTAQAIAKLDEAVVYAIGKDKWPALRRLSETHNINEQPAQALRHVPKLTVFSDYLGEK